MKFQPFASAVDAGFWQALAEEKLNKLRLDDSPIPVHMYYHRYHNHHTGDCTVHVGPSAFTHAPTASPLPPNTCSTVGRLINFNSLDAFKAANKSELLQHYARDWLWSALAQDCGVLAFNEPHRLISALLLTFVDLKRYRHYYWFAFPTVLWPRQSEVEWTATRALSSVLSEEQQGQLALKYQQMAEANSVQSGFFVVEGVSSDISATDIKVSPLNRILSAAESSPIIWGNALIAFVDPCGLQDSAGWPARNLIALLYAYLPTTSIRLLAYRPEIVVAGSEQRRFSVVGKSLVFDVKFHRNCNLPVPLPVTIPDCVGWERDLQGRLLPRFADLASSMDPNKLAESTVDLNLKLMKWRQAPELQLEPIRNSRYLLIGAGTLGCYAARCLMGWGVRNLTLVDNGLVSHSNILRQPLFEFADYRKPKAEAAALALKRILPAIQSNGIRLTIPMPGHPDDNDRENLERTVKQLEKLFQENDIIFIGTDTRESRWLPTVLGNLYGKMVINVALGFDTFLVMRHGVPIGDKKERDGAANEALERLGCYFCNDIVAPTDSMRNRTLDQECTVTRPGLAPMAAASAVELAASLLQHPLGPKAPADKDNCDGNTTSSSRPLSSLPHQLRHFLSTFNTIQISGQHFPNCTACSDPIITAYQERGWQFVYDICNDPTLLTKISGLDQMLAGVEREKQQIDWDEEDYGDWDAADDSGTEGGGTA